MRRLRSKREATRILRPTIFSKLLEPQGVSLAIGGLRAQPGTQGRGLKSNGMKTYGKGSTCKTENILR
ncbi:hypothetical protein EOW52_25575 [Salmonella enterica]|nr:hypothetical protein CHD70_26865 [Salmonella enterica]EBV3373401.1 hypothetical protein [Salmonella enterica subsp. enterica serovar Senftenberg]ECT6597565.1 hypothetical protein [Salmonella enterica subsp. enterica serovar Ealing]EAP3547506.1 hypothetical protein [Salmonella enterica]EAU6767341.1 hypothetical protein [Salmonella enterica]